MEESIVAGMGFEVSLQTGDHRFRSFLVHAIHGYRAVAIARRLLPSMYPGEVERSYSVTGPVSIYA